MPKKMVTGRPERVPRASVPRRCSPLAALTNRERRAAGLAKLRAALTTTTKKETA